MRFLDRFRQSRASADDLMEHELLVPTPDAGQELGIRVLDGRDDVPLIVVQDDEGRLVLPAFTSEEALNRWKPQGSHFIGLKGEVLVQLLAESEWDRMVIDGADAGAFAITRADARRIVRISSH